MQQEDIHPATPVASNLSGIFPQFDAGRVAELLRIGHTAKLGYREKWFNHPYG
jgi:hypothetical protein